MSSPGEAGDLPLAVTQGEPSGIGPEITFKAWLQPAIVACRPSTRSATCILEVSARSVGWPVPVRAASAAEASEVFAGALPVVPLATGSAVPGRPDPAAAERRSNRSLRPSHMQGRGSQARSSPTRSPSTSSIAPASAIPAIRNTSPPCRRNPAALPSGHDAVERGSRGCAGDSAYPAEGCRVRVDHGPDRADGAHRGARLAKRFGLTRPRLAVAGLNPHAGERATLGTEERDVVAPAVAETQAEGLAVTGPWPADTLFHAERAAPTTRRWPCITTRPSRRSRRSPSTRR